MHVKITKNAQDEHKKMPVNIRSQIPDAIQATYDHCMRVRDLGVVYVSIILNFNGAMPLICALRDNTITIFTKDELDALVTDV